MPADSPLWVCHLWSLLCITLVWSEASHWVVVSDSSWEGLQSRPLSTATCVQLGMPKEVQYDLQFVAACAELVAT